MVVAVAILPGRMLLALTILLERTWLLLICSLGQTSLTQTCSLIGLLARTLIARMAFLVKRIKQDKMKKKFELVTPDRRINVEKTGIFASFVKRKQLHNSANYTWKKGKVSYCTPSQNDAFLFPLSTYDFIISLPSHNYIIHLYN